MGVIHAFCCNWFLQSFNSNHTRQEVFQSSSQPSVFLNIGSLDMKHTEKERTLDSIKIRPFKLLYEFVPIGALN